MTCLCSAAGMQSGEWQAGSSRMMAGDCPWLVPAAIGNVKSDFDFTLQAYSKPWALYIWQVQEQGRIISGAYYITVTVTEAKTPFADQPLRMIILSSCSNGEAVESVMTYPSALQAPASFLVKKNQS